MASRADLVEGMKGLLGDDYFIYGSYEYRPTHLPYGNYGEVPMPYLYADNHAYFKIERYIVRIVCDHKDFALEEAIELLFETLDICFTKITSEYIKTEKVYCTEWDVQFHG